MAVAVSLSRANIVRIAGLIVVGNTPSLGTGMPVNHSNTMCRRSMKACSSSSCRLPRTLARDNPCLFFSGPDTSELRHQDKPSSLRKSRHPGPSADIAQASMTVIGAPGPSSVTVTSLENGRPGMLYLPGYRVKNTDMATISPQAPPLL